MNAPLNFEQTFVALLIKFLAQRLSEQHNFKPKQQSLNTGDLRAKELNSAGFGATQSIS